MVGIEESCNGDYGELDDENTDGDHNKILINKKARTSLYMNGGNIVITRFHERQSTKFWSCFESFFLWLKASTWYTINISFSNADKMFHKGTLSCKNFVNDDAGANCYIKEIYV